MNSKTYLPALLFFALSSATLHAKRENEQIAAAIHEKAIAEKLLLELKLDMEDARFSAKPPLVLKDLSQLNYDSAPFPTNETQTPEYMLTLYLEGTIHEKKNLGELLLEMDLQIEDARLSDEPPGVLRILKFITKDNKNQKFEIRFFLQRSPSLFSEKRKWKQDLVKSASVKTVSIQYLAPNRRSPVLPSKD